MGNRLFKKRFPFGIYLFIYFYMGNLPLNNFFLKKISLDFKFFVILIFLMGIIFFKSEIIPSRDDFLLKFFLKISLDSQFFVILIFF